MPGVRTLIERRQISADGTDVVPGLLEVDAEDFTARGGRGGVRALDRPGPLRRRAQLVAALREVPGSLTATVHVEQSDDLDLTELLPALQSLAGRIVFNGYPTGVRVGVGAAPRRAVAGHQLHPHLGGGHRDEALPAADGVAGCARARASLELRDGPADLPRRIDGVLTLPAGR